MSTLIVHGKGDCPFYVPYPLIELCTIRNRLRYKADQAVRCVDIKHPLYPLKADYHKHIIVESAERTEE